MLIYNRSEISKIPRASRFKELGRIASLAFRNGILLEYLVVPCKASGAARVYDVMTQRKSAGRGLLAVPDLDKHGERVRSKMLDERGVRMKI